MSDLCELILITGFLGAGKTTVLRRLLGMNAGKRVHLIVNEFGKIGVDGALLKDLGATMDEIVNGSIFCVCRLDQFEAALDEVQKLKPELLIVEASGLSDPTAIRSLLEQGGRYPDIHYRGCIALADATRLHRVIDTARVCHKQLSVADLILLTKTDIALPDQIAAAEELLHTRYPGIPVVHAVEGNIAKELVDTLSTSHPALDESYARDLTLQKRCLEISQKMAPDELRSFLRLFVEDTHRIKGFVKLGEKTFLVDCVGSYIKVSPAQSDQADNRLVVLASEGMPLRKSLKEALAWYKDSVCEVSQNT
ncbi:MAG: GTP-binding protein [Clostridiales bacterium]|nr:GTP-binding protein [Clostridiales bacterium]